MKKKASSAAVSALQVAMDGAHLPPKKKRAVDGAHLPPKKKKLRRLLKKIRRIRRKPRHHVKTAMVLPNLVFKKLTKSLKGSLKKELAKRLAEKAGVKPIDVKVLFFYAVAVVGAALCGQLFFCEFMTARSPPRRDLSQCRGPDS